MTDQQGASQTPPNPPTGPSAGAPPGMTRDEINWAIFAHISAFAVFVGVPFGNILGPLVIWLIQRDKMPFVEDQGKESLNFQLSMTIYLVISAFLILVLIGIVLVFVVVLLDIILVIVAAIAASRGERYRYPLAIRFIR